MNYPKTQTLSFDRSIVKGNKNYKSKGNILLFRFIHSFVVRFSIAPLSIKKELVYSHKLYNIFIYKKKERGSFFRFQKFWNQIAMSVRRRTLLKVIVLGDSGYVLCFFILFKHFIIYILILFCFWISGSARLRWWISILSTFNSLIREIIIYVFQYLSDFFFIVFNLLFLFFGLVFFNGSAC